MNSNYPSKDLVSVILKLNTEEECINFLNDLCTIQELEKMLKDNTISGNKNVVNSVLQGSRDILGIQSTDEEFVSNFENYFEK